MLYPFVLMDMPADNGLPDPYGGAAASRPIPGAGGSPAIRRPAEPGSAGQERPRRATRSTRSSATRRPATSLSRRHASAYSGPADDWGYRRFVLHYAQLAERGRRCRCVPDRFGAARPDDGARRRERPSLRRGAVRRLPPTCGRSLGTGTEDHLRRGLERVFRPSADGRQRRRVLPSRSALGARCDRLRSASTTTCR